MKGNHSQFQFNARPNADMFMYVSVTSIKACFMRLGQLALTAWPASNVFIDFAFLPPDRT